MTESDLEKRCRELRKEVAFILAELRDLPLPEDIAFLGEDAAEKLYSAQLTLFRLSQYFRGVWLPSEKLRAGGGQNPTRKPKIEGPG
jgi:hypothetical protein